jgi:tRNA threonylcarbamoyladenosine biosynthesis protein TsaB
LRDTQTADARPRTILAIDTATAAGSVALRVEGRTLERAIAWRASFRGVAPAIAELMGEAALSWDDLDGVAVPGGPGSFTGLRIGAALALGLARIARRPLYAVPTLAAVAEALAPPDARRVCATLDARRGRRYAALYERAGPGCWELVAGPVDADPTAVEEFAGASPRVGPDPDQAGHGRTLAGAIARLAAARPAAYAPAAPGRLELVYARAAVDGT